MGNSPVREFMKYHEFELLYWDNFSSIYYLPEWVEKDDWTVYRKLPRELF